LVVARRRHSARLVIAALQVSALSVSLTVTEAVMPDYVDHEPATQGGWRPVVADFVAKVAN
jgi:hypothetical protein